jgi:hypothetical protein
MLDHMDDISRLKIGALTTQVGHAKPATPVQPAFPKKQIRSRDLPERRLMT